MVKYTAVTHVLLFTNRLYQNRDFYNSWNLIWKRNFVYWGVHLKDLIPLDYRFDYNQSILFLSIFPALATSTCTSVHAPISRYVHVHMYLSLSLSLSLSLTRFEYRHIEKYLKCLFKTLKRTNHYYPPLKMNMTSMYCTKKK